MFDPAIMTKAHQSVLQYEKQLTRQGGSGLSLGGAKCSLAKYNGIKTASGDTKQTRVMPSVKAPRVIKCFAYGEIGHS